MIGVTFMQDDVRMASTRLRNVIPMKQLRVLGFTGGRDIFVVSKDNWRWSDNVRKRFGKIIFDICDDWFDHPLKGDHYHLVCDKADLITCNSLAMQARIKEATGHESIVIDDPYEDPDLPAGKGEGVCWFGHAINLSDLNAVLDQIRYPLTIVTNASGPNIIAWTSFEQANAIDRCAAVVIPTGRSMCKSANRAVTAIRRGRYVVCGELPAYREIPGIWVGNIAEGLELAMTADTKPMINKAKSYVNERFSPARIGDEWKKAITSIL